MANPRPEERSTQNMEEAARRTGERAAEQTTRIGQARLKPAKKWHGPVLICSSKMLRRYSRPGAPASRRRPHKWDGQASNLAARLAYLKKMRKRKRRQPNGQLATRRRSFTVVQPPPN